MTFAYSRRRLLKSIDEDRVRKAIQAAETRTSGEIRVSVSPFFWGNVQRAAERAFARLGMAATQERNGVLFFLVPARRRFAVIGDAGIHERVGPVFWKDVAAAVAERFRKGDFTGGLVHGIEIAGAELATHFPYDAKTDRNELPNEVDFGKGD